MTGRNEALALGGVIAMIAVAAVMAVTFAITVLSVTVDTGEDQTKPRVFDAHQIEVIMLEPNQSFKLTAPTWVMMPTTGPVEAKWGCLHPAGGKTGQITNTAEEVPLPILTAGSCAP